MATREKDNNITKKSMPDTIGVTVSNMESVLLIDSGAAVTVLSVKLWQKIPEKQRPELDIRKDTVDC